MMRCLAGCCFAACYQIARRPSEPFVETSTRRGGRRRPIRCDETDRVTASRTAAIPREVHNGADRTVEKANESAVKVSGFTL